MNTFVKDQAFLLAMAFALGAVIGICYDILRPLRYRCSAFIKVGTDFVFALLSAVLLFLFAMSAGNGRLGVWELAAALAGFLAYLYTLSDMFFAAFDKAFLLICRGGRAFGKHISDAANLVKKIFKKISECYIIKKRI